MFPLHSPLVESLEVTRYGSVRRARLYYLRGLQGRAARIKELNPVQRRKVQEATAAAMAELEAQAALTNAEAEELEELETEEAIIDSGAQATGGLEDTMVNEAEDTLDDESSEDAPPEDTLIEDPPDEESEER